MKNSLILVALAVALFQVYVEGNVYNGFFDPLDRFTAEALEFNNGDTYANGDVNRALRRLGSNTKEKVDKRGIHYKGSFDDEGRFTKGTVTLPNGDVMNGEFKYMGIGFLRLRKGSIKFHDGDILENYDADGDEGTIRYANGDVFRGKIKMSSDTVTYQQYPKKFKGKYVSREGVRYKGKWGDHSMDEAFGTIKYPNGDVYEGSWFNLMPWGDGEMTYSNGEVVYGYWYKGKLLFNM